MIVSIEEEITLPKQDIVKVDNGDEETVHTSKTKLSNHSEVSRV